MDDLDRLGALGDPTRRALFRLVADSPEPVGRDAAAQAVGISRALAAFHLDRLVEAGLLGVEYRRLTGRTGPGAGRPAKLYRPAADGLQVSLPLRRYDRIAELLASGIEEAAETKRRGSGATRSAIDDAAERLGRRLGSEVRERIGDGPEPEAAREALVDG
ncbi:MAG TPA: helix-turn-helix domain-containing protein, partial [Candidatus Limnocylindrales bacterium]|nr:helix-turn-helix domain-containing protein [Candidatus Limnocylindrales bacterium]